MTLGQLESDLAELQSEQGNMSVSSPMSGKITLNANFDVGSQVSKTTKIGTISDTTQFKVKLPFSLQEAVQLKKVTPWS